MEQILKYFPNITSLQLNQFMQLEHLYRDWNLKINLVSRNDVEELYLRHVLHSIAIAKWIQFFPSTKILDVGTGGGFPGIPLAILFPEAHFTLVDAVGKKIRVVDEVIDALGLTNAIAINNRVENLKGTFHFVVSRAVATMPTFMYWIEGKENKKQFNTLKNGVLYLKGGALEEELSSFPNSKVFDLKDVFEESFFDTKKLVYLPFFT